MLQKIRERFESTTPPTKKKRFLLIIPLILIIAVVAFALTRKDEPEISQSYIGSILSKASELTTAKLTYTGMTKYTGTGIPIINKDGFRMTYKATANAGIDLSDVDVVLDEDAKVIKLTIPKAEITEVNVDPSTIEYFDENFALFNFDKKEHANEAQAMAQEAASEDLAEMGVLELADQQAEEVVKGLLRDAVPDDYTFEVTRK